MIKRYLAILTGLMIVLQGLLVFASNRHEHLYSLPLAENFRPVTNEIFNLSPDIQRVKQMVHDPENFKQLLMHNFNLSDQQAEKFTRPERYENLTLFELCSSLPGSAANNLLRLLTIHSSFVDTPEHARLLYLTVESLRRNLLLDLSSTSLERVFVDYFKHEAFENRDIIDISVPHELFSEIQISKLSTIRNVAERYGTRMNFFASVPRQRMASRTDEEMQTQERLISEGLISGFDITGSIIESAQQRTRINFRRALEMWFQESANHHVPLQIHAFEAANEGPFYTALEEVIRTFPQPINIRIGHINHIDDRWIQILRSNPNVHVSATATLAGNMFMQEGTLENLLGTISKLRRAGIEVLYGSDGRGIVPNSSYAEQVQTVRRFRLRQQQQPTARACRLMLNL